MGELNPLTFSYIMFVIEVMKNETKSLCLALNCLNFYTKQLNFRQEQRLRQIIKFINHKVGIYNKKPISEKTEKLDFYNSISYDNNLYETFNMLKECLFLKKIALYQIGQNHINLTEVIGTFTLLRQKRDKLYTNLKQLAVINHSCGILMQMIDIFERSLYYQNSLTQAIQKKIKQRKAEFKCLLNFYSEDSCVIFITLLKEIGTIKRVTKNLEQVVPILNSQEAIGKNISYMQPKEISQVHNKILTNFITKQNLSFQIKNYDIIIGVDKNGWAIPYQMKLQTCLIGTSDFGACTWIKQIQDSCYYISTKYEQNYEIMTISYGFYQILFSKVVSPSKVQNISLESLMPSLNYFIKTQCPKEINRYSTIIVKPQNEEFCFSKDNFTQSDDLVQNLLKEEIFKIEADFYPFHHKYISFVQIKVHTIEKITDHKDKFDHQFIDQQKLILLSYLQNNNNGLNKKKLVQKKQTFVQSASFELNGNKKNLQKQNSLYLQENSELQQLNDEENCQKNDNQRNYQSEHKNEIQLIDQVSFNIPFDQLSPRDTDIFTQRHLIQPLPSSQFWDQFTYINYLSNQQLIQHPNSSQKNLVTIQEETNEKHIQQNKLFKADQIKQESQKIMQQIDQKNQLVQKKLGNFQQLNSGTQLKLLSQNNLESTEEQLSKIRCSSQSKQAQIQQKSDSTQKSNISHQHKQMIDYLQQSHKIYGLETIKYLGCITLVVMLILNVNSFVTLNTYLMEQREEYIYSDWVYKINLISQQIVGDISFLRMMKLTNFELPDPEEQKKFMAAIKDGQIQRKNYFQKLLIAYTNSKVQQGTQVFKEVSKQTVDFDFAYSLTSVDKQHISLYYALLEIYCYEFLTSDWKKNNDEEYYQLLINEIQLINKLDDFEKDVVLLVEQKYQEIRDSLFVSQLCDIISSTIFSLSFIPIFVYVQLKTKQFIGLLATFNPQKIKEMQFQVLYNEKRAERLSEQLNQKQKQIIKEEDNYKSGKYSQITSFEIQKNKNISSVSRLPLFQLKTLIYALCFILFNCTYSLAIGINMNNFMNDQENNSEFLNKINQIHSLTISIIEMEIILIDTRLEFDDDNTYKIYTEAIVEKSLKIQSALNDFYEIMAKQSKINRYQKNKFNKFINQMLEGNLCEVVNQNLQYLIIPGYNQTECEQVKFGIFSKGLITATKQFLDFVGQNGMLLNEEDDVAFFEGANKLFEDFPVKQQFYFKMYYTFSISAIQGFIESITYQEYDYLILLNRLFIALQISLFASSIYLIYFRFFTICSKQIQSTKRLLDIIDVAQLNDNQYINSFFRTNK
ncbi:transmembrane protein, putative (macronuclear) [Tetrahymena thermophila SB210]|uniref:Transmembrane protein, putative n=1 Tax=Tetrahymena thermophila (strain SB210) TaxID=312017 RepID=I7LZQ0_TETTS|nr:transmembrane protein, putative [Tetrahymena thermophila SB210]EAR84593.2 transmembrane protein, putative [Tetrahymena thermophila SB210]|eukprot:XP_001032256.2 transmembrane protein, putative [Tetrahymena thermophila SB210]